MADETVAWVDHPSDVDLLALAAGKLAGAQANKLEQHLQDCATCGSRFDALSLQADSLVARLRQQQVEPISEGDTQSLAVDPSTFTAPRGEHDPEADATMVYQPPAESSAARNSSSPSFGNYEILSKIAQGGMGVVFKARHRKLDRVVALKRILAGQLAGGEQIERFYEEARAAARLRHPNIVAIHEIGELEGQPFFTMDFIEGESLAAKLRERPLAGREAAELLVPVAQAVHYAHQQGIIHRDLKPANVLVDELNRPHVTDFGLAKRLDSESGLTISGQALGTPSYMPPEQADGDHARIGPTSDVYALGAMLYAMLTGRPPFTAATIGEVLRQVMAQEPVAPRKLNPAIDVDLDTICLKCLEKEPAKRYASAQELADELQRFLRGEPIFARPISRPAKAWCWCKRNPVVASLSAAVLVVLLVSVAVSSALAFVAQQRAVQLRATNQDLGTANANLTSQQRKLETEQKEVRRVNIELKKTLMDVTVARDDAKRELRKSELLLYHSHIDKAARALTDHDFVTAQQELALCAEEFRHVEYNYLAAKYNEFAPLQLMAHEKGVTALAMSADGTTLYSGGEDETIRVWDLKSGEVVAQLTSGSGYVASLQLSRDGSSLYAGFGDGTITAWNTKSNAEAFLLTGREGYLTELILSHDGKRLVSSGDVIKIWDLEKRSLVSTLRGHFFGTHALLLSDRDARLFSAGGDGQIGEWQPPDEAAKRSFKATSDVPTVLLASQSDENQLVIGGSEGGLVVWDTERGTKVLSRAAHLRNVTAMVRSPDGKHLYTSSFDKTVKEWRLPTLELVRTLTGHTNKVLSLAISPDGSRLFSGGADRIISVWELHAEMPPSTIPISDRAITSLAISDDGSQLYAGSSGLLIDIVDLSAQKVTASLKGPFHGTIADLELSENGKLLYAANLDEPSITVWDTNQKKIAKRLRGHSAGIRRLSLSSDGNWLTSTGSDGYVMLWDLQAGSVACKRHQDATEVAFTSTNDQLVTITSDGPPRLVLWNAKDKTRLQHADAVVVHTEQISSLVASDDPPCVYVGSAEGTINRVDLPTRKVTHALTGHSESITDLELSADKRRLFSIGNDKSIRIWDTELAIQTLVLTGHDQIDAHLAFSPVGPQLYSGGRNGALHRWSLVSSIQKRDWKPLAVDTDDKQSGIKPIE